MVAVRNGCDGCSAVAPVPLASQMSVVSLARTAGVTWLLSNSRSLIVSTSFELALISMMSTSPWATISRISWRNSSSVRKRASPA